MRSLVSLRLKTALALSILYLVWGSTYLAIRVAVETIPPAIMAGSRHLTAGLMMLAVALLRREPFPTRAREWATAATVGLLLLLLGNGLVCWAEQFVASGLTALIVCSIPLWLLSMEALVPGGERLGRHDVASLLIGLAGIGILVSPQIHLNTGTSAAGVLGLVAASISWALGSTLARHGPMPASIWATSTIEMLAGGLALLATAAAGGEFERFRFASVTAGGWLSWGYLVVGGSVIAFSAYTWLLAHVRPSLVTTYAYVNPVVAVVLGVVILGETVGPSTFLGAVVTLSSVVMVTRRKKEAAGQAKVTP